MGPLRFAQGDSGWGPREPRSPGVRRRARPCGRLLAARARPALAARARLRERASGHRRPLARHGVAGDPRPRYGSSGSTRRPTSGSAGRRRSSTAAWPTRCSRRTVPDWAAHVGPGGVGPGDLYYPVYRTPAVIAFNSRIVARADAPHDWDDVLAPRWFDKVLIRDPMASGTMRAIWGLVIERSLRATGDTAAGMAWLRRLDRQTKAYALNPAILDARLARAEGLVTLWDLPDILISRSKGMPFDYVFPRSGTVVIDDAIGLVRGSRHADAASRLHRLRRKHGGAAAGRARRSTGCRPATICPTSRIPAWVAEVEREMVVADVDWSLLAREGAAWMGYWDRTCGAPAGRRGHERLPPARGPGQAVRRHGRGRSRLARPRAGRAARAARAERQRQDHDAPAAGGVRDARTKAACSSSSEDVTAVAPVSRRFGMVFQHYALFPHLDVRAQRGLRSRIDRDPWRRPGASRGPGAGAGGPGGFRRAPHRPALGRTAAARGAGPRAGAGAARALAGRAALQPRPHAARAHAPRDPRPDPPGRHHHGARDPRAGRGLRARRPGGRHARRAAGAGRHARRALRGAGQRVRRGVRGTLEHRAGRGRGSIGAGRPDRRRRRRVGYRHHARPAGARLRARR